MVPALNFQAGFAQRWAGLRDPHVRALAWLIDAPDLLDPAAAQWQGKIASLSELGAADAGPWLHAQDANPQALHDWLGMNTFTRLGRYAEKLMAWYFAHLGILAAHGVQVREGKSATIGEFDFLLRAGASLLHWEFATKFYLLEPGGGGQEADYFVGPNLADTLGAKMHKILDRQLALARHPAAQIHLTHPVVSAQALVKGWLFYHAKDAIDGAAMGLARDHCRGFWCALEEFAPGEHDVFFILQRLAWLAPARIAHGDALSAAQLRAYLRMHFSHDSMPVMVAVLQPQGSCVVERERGFIVPDDWRARAADRIGLAT